MDKSVDGAEQELTKLRTGRAHTSLLDHITVEYYGTEVPLNRCERRRGGLPDADASRPGKRRWCRSIEKAILKSDLGLNPATAGTVIRVPLPPLTEERRKDMIRIVRHEAEDGAVAIRNIRRDALGDVKDLLKEKMIGRGRRAPRPGRIQASPTSTSRKSTSSWPPRKTS